MATVVKEGETGLYLDTLNEFSVLFGLFNVNHFKLINHVIRIGKQVIYICRARKIKPTINVFFVRLRYIMIELNIQYRAEVTYQGPRV